MQKENDKVLMRKFLSGMTDKAVAKRRCFEQAQKAVKSYEANSAEVNRYLKWKCCSFKFIRPADDGREDPEIAFGFFFAQLFE